MGKSKETSGKKEVRNKLAKKRKEKVQRRIDKKEQGSKSFNDMIAWVDENGRITNTPPDPTRKKVEIELESIEIGTPKAEFRETKQEKIRTGKVIFYDDSKGYGFISDTRSRESIFVHVNECEGPIRVGDTVEFEVESSPRGPKAVRVKVVPAVA
jgi:cold shock CspA family protein